MNLDLSQLGEAAVFSGIVAMGFGAMFNVSWKDLTICFGIAGLAGIVKILGIEAGLLLAAASFLGALTAGILAILASRSRRCPPSIYSIPAVIPMVPGVPGFKTILGALEILQLGADSSPEIVARTMILGLTTVSVAIALAVGISLPGLTRMRE
jgi:uncharacterized membrane protein YjjB (DUF3815 family)